MSREEIIKALGIKPDKIRTIPKENIDWGSKEGSFTAKLELHYSVFNLDEWEESKGRELLSRSGIHRTSELNRMEDEGDAAGELMADFFAAGFRQYPEVENQCYDTHRQQFIETLLESPDFKALHNSTKGNVYNSEVAAMEFANKYSKYIRKSPDQAGQNTPKSPDLPPIACYSAVSRALEQAQSEIDQMEAFTRGCGCEENLNSHIDLEKTVQQFNRVKNDPRLRRIMELAGRYRLTAQAEQRQKVLHGYDDMVGVELAGDISRLLPLELAKLGSEELELDTMRRLVEGQTMCRQYRGIEKLGKGPIVVCVDESGSMNGEPIAQAKAFCLAMVWLADHQQRDIILSSFSIGESTRLLIISPRCKGNRNTKALLDWMQGFHNGGTDLIVPLAVIPNKWDEFKYIVKGKTDQIIITDAVLTIHDNLKHHYMKWKKKEQVRTITIVIGTSEGQMGEVSDEVYCMPVISADSDAISSCFSI